ELRDVEDAVLGLGMDANLLHAEPDARHRLPVVGLEPLLHPPELKPGDHPDVVAEAPERVPGVREPDQGLGAHGSVYKNLYIRGNRARGDPHATGRVRPGTNLTQHPTEPLVAPRPWMRSSPLDRDPPHNWSLATQNLPIRFGEKDTKARLLDLAARML